MSAFIERLAGVMTKELGLTEFPDAPDVIRAILTEMRELSTAEINACPMEPAPRDLEYWRATIDAALKEGQ